jgi:hypothetical protein
MAQIAHDQAQRELDEMIPIEFLLAQPIFRVLCIEAMTRGLIKREPLD